MCEVLLLDVSAEVLLPDVWGSVCEVLLLDVSTGTHPSVVHPLMLGFSSHLLPLNSLQGSGGRR